MPFLQRTAATLVLQPVPSGGNFVAEG